jgi:signal transduction histidine kinase
VTSGSDELFSNGGEMGALMARFDWSATALGPVSDWSPALRTMVGLLLRNRFPMLLWWGPRFVQLYNDAYRPVPGAKHPRSLGQPASECWAEIWHVIGPMIEEPFRGGAATSSDDLALMIRRRGFLEESHFKVAYSPVPDPSAPNGIGGVLATVAETTEEVYGRRQLAMLRVLAGHAAEAKTGPQACERAALTLKDNAKDVPFALFYLVDAERKTARLTASAGFDDWRGAAPPASFALGDDAPGWPVARAMREGRAIVAEAPSLALPCGAWEQRPERVVILPLAAPGQPTPYGVLVAAASPHRELDEAYLSFFELAAQHVASAVRNATAHEDARKTAEALAALDRAKTAFFSNVSHEFRTPLTLMLAPIEDLRAAGLGGTEGRAQIELLHRNARRLLKLVNTLLDFARIEAGRVQAVYEPTDLATLTSDLASTFRSAIERAGLTYLVDTPPLPSAVHVDRSMWETIVLNLVSNAFKFTLEGAITVRQHAVDGGVELEVSDTGVGIRADELPRLFERFHRIEGSRARSHEGSGIGLALVHELVRLHGGRIGARTKEGEGTTFTVSIPLGTAHLPADGVRTDRGSSWKPTSVAYVEEALRWVDTPGRGPSPPDVERPSSRGLPRARIVFADDNADLREYVSKLLREHWEVEAVSNGRAALDAARRVPPDLVLSDVMMPELDGFGLLRAIRDDASLCDTPVVLLSARAGEEAVSEGLSAGADDYLVKPFTARELLVRVAARLAATKSAREHRRALEDSRREAEEANRAKDDFLAMLGHELRNPLAPIATAVHLLKLRTKEGHARELSIIERQTQHIARLVDDLLDVARIARGKVVLDRDSVEVSDLIAAAIETASPLIEAGQHSLVVNVPKRGMVVDVDRERMTQVLANLLTNAAKYTPAGGRLGITADREGSDVVISVEDDGVGISAELLPHVFDLFVQARQTLDRAQGGLGLGLALVKNLVAMHGATVSAHSAGRGHGSTFTVRIPRLDAPATEERPSSSVMPAAPKRRRILIVDDNADGADMLAEVVESLGYRTALAGDGPGALRVAGDFVPDVALLDIGLPVMDGYELAARLRERQREVKLVAITGYGQDGDRARSSAAGFHAHLTKPVDFDQLAKLLAKLSASPCAEQTGAERR